MNPSVTLLNKIDVLFHILTLPIWILDLCPRGEIWNNIRFYNICIFNFCIGLWNINLRKQPTKRNVRHGTAITVCHTFIALRVYMYVWKLLYNTYYVYTSSDSSREFQNNCSSIVEICYFKVTSFQTCLAFKESFHRTISNRYLTKYWSTIFAPSLIKINFETSHGVV